MKRIATVILIMLFVLTGCNGRDTDDVKDTMIEVSNYDTSEPKAFPVFAKLSLEKDEWEPSESITLTLNYGQAYELMRLEETLYGMKIEVIQNLDDGDSNTVLFEEYYEGKTFIHDDTTCRVGGSGEGYSEQTQCDYTREIILDFSEMDNQTGSIALVFTQTNENGIENSESVIIWFELSDIITFRETR